MPLIIYPLRQMSSWDMCTPMGRLLTRKCIKATKDLCDFENILTFSELQLHAKGGHKHKVYLLHIVFVRIGEQ